MYSFEGTYKSNLVQSLGRRNLSKTDQLLADVQQKRQNRERIRLETRSAIKIQSCYRSYIARRREFAREKAEFVKLVERGVPSVLHVEGLVRSITFFFVPKDDDMDMVSVCGLAVRSQSIFKQFVSSIHCLHLTKKWLVAVSGVLKRLSESTENLSMPLRVMEIFLDEAVYASKESMEKNILLHIYQALIAQGYFDMLRQMCDKRLPTSVEIGTTTPTPLASSLLSLMLRPMLMTLPQHSAFSFMTPAYTPQVYCYILPSVKTTPHAPIAAALIGALKMVTNTPQIEWNSTLLHSFMVMLEGHIGGLDNEMITYYLDLVSEMFAHLSDSHSFAFDDDEQSEMDWSSGFGTVISLPQMRTDCLRIINSPDSVNKLITLCRRYNSGLDVLRVARLCHMLTSKLKQAVHSNRLMYSLAFDRGFLRMLWNECVTISVLNSAGNTVSLMQVLSRGLGDSLYTSVQGSIHKLMSLLSAFSSLYYHAALTLHDDDFKPKRANPQEEAYVSSNAFSRAELIAMVSTLRDACLGIVYLAIPDSKPVFEDRRKFLEAIGIKTNTDKTITKESYAKQRSEWIYLFDVTARLTKHLYIRDTRTHFCPSNHWLSSQVRVQANDLRSIYQNHIEVFNKRPLRPGIGDDDEDEVTLSVTDTRRLVVLTELPFVVPFEERVQIFHNLIGADKVNYQSGFDGYGPMSQAAINVNIRRDYIYEDAFEKLSPENEANVKPKIRVHMKNSTGLSEAGIDGGGIFREFLSELLKTGFDPNRGLFKLTASNDKMLYPNPEATTVMENCEKHFFFLGRMLGKTLYENMLVELPFAGFFLTKILGKTDSDFHQLSSLDPTLYKNLRFVKNYEGDVTELGLDFSVVTESLGITSHIELKADGKQTVVNNNNRIEYVHLMADYKLNKQIRTQCHAFTQGLEDVIKVEWLRMFNHHELHVVISGATSPIDVDDLRLHTHYSGEYTSEHPAIYMFWKVVEEFTGSQRSSLLKFVTSCSRPPLLGFKDLYPAFCIHYGGKEDRLPSASTCMNFLKLPEYPDEDTMRSKLLYAIESGAGFELS